MDEMWPSRSMVKLGKREFSLNESRIGVNKLRTSSDKKIKRNA
jgi:hypothetical protein